jgi:NADH-quinone oxidoreductase subunit M
MPLPSYLLESPDGIPWLTLLLLSPLVGILLVGVAALLRLDDRTVKLGVTAWMLLPIGLAVVVWAGFDPSLVGAGQGMVQFVEKMPWIEAVRVDYFVGVDGISLPLVLLTVVMAPIAALALPPITERVKAHYALLLLLELAMLGYFLALDFFFFFIFWEFSLVPAFFLILMWGGLNRRNAAFQFFVYTVSGSIGMLLLFQFIYLAVRYAGFPTFDLIALGRLGQGLGVNGITDTLSTMLYTYADHLGITQVLGNNPLVYSGIAFWAIFIAFAIKLAVWPFHTWLPDTYTEAPTSGSILLSAVMSKMGAYGMLRILLPFVPEAAQFFAPVMAALALLGIVAGAFGALSYVRGNIKRLIAYTSINHMGYVMLAIAAIAASGAGSGLAAESLINSRAMAMNGALMQMVAHGLSTGALFLLAGMLFQRTGTYNLSELGGLRTVMPHFAGVMGVAMFANLGLPGLAGFVGEFFIFRGAWATLPLFTLLATIGLVVTALALLLMFKHIFLGPIGARWLGKAQPPDIRSGEFWTAAPLLVLLLLLGVYPALVMNLSNTATTGLVMVFERILT